MAFREIALDTILARGDTIEVEATYSYLPFTVPSDAEIFSAMEAHPYAEPIKVEQPFLDAILSPFGRTVKIQMKVGGSGVSASDIAQKVKEILAGFVRVFGVNIGAIRIETFSPGDLVPDPNVGQVVAISAVAIIFVVLLIFMIRLGIKRG